MSKHVVVIGASGAIGRSLVEHMCADEDISCIHACSRSELQWEHKKIKSYCVDIEEEASVRDLASQIAEFDKLDKVIVATGILHRGDLQPEKSLRDICSDNMQKVFAVNTIGPALIAKCFLPLLRKDRKSIFAVLSARVGSISDNKLGGWYAYRASKAALNMIIKTASIEMQRVNKQAIVLGLHPGTVDSHLSSPFQKNVAEGKLFSADYAAQCLLTVLSNATHENTGKIFAWDGSIIEY